LVNTSYIRKLLLQEWMMRKKIFISTENSEYQIIESLKNNRAKRTKKGEIFVEGIEAIKQAFNANLEFTRIIYRKNKKLSNWADGFIRTAKVGKVIEASDDIFRKLCDKQDPSELIATIEMNKLSIDNLRYSSSPFFLVFDRPSDLGNFGTIIRTANSFKVDAILVIGHSVDVFNPKVIRSSLGSIFFTPIIQLDSIHSFEQWIIRMKKNFKMEVVGSDSTGEVSLDSHVLKSPIAFILGNEAKGMSVALKSLCDYIIRIPNLGNVNSLNVSCAGSIILWEIFRQDHKSMAVRKN